MSPSNKNCQNFLEYYNINLRTDFRFFNVDTSALVPVVVVA